MTKIYWKNAQESFDNKTDIWSAGFILYTLLSGKQPYDGDPRSILDFEPVKLNNCSTQDGGLIEIML